MKSNIPKIGDRIKLLTGEEGEVVFCENATSILKQMNEGQAMQFGPEKQAVYGKYWLDIYYRADVVLDNGKILTIEPNDVDMS